jgi:hypothetical protein
MSSIVKKIAACFVSFLIILGQAGAQETEGAEAEKKSLYPALLGGLFVNTTFHLTSRLLGADFAQTSLKSVKTNLNSPWVWDSDVFLLNHPGHPYQGGLYHAAARSNGFSFYESVFFDNLGSLTWELFGETDLPSLNDLVVTTFGGAAFGEMLHRLYLEAESPWAVLVSPMDALNNAVFQKRPPRTHNLYHLSAMAGPGWVQSIKEDKQKLQQMRDNNSRIPPPPNIYTGNIGCEVIYGNPFGQYSKKPYSQFEIRMQLGSSIYPLWLDWTILTDAYLVSFNPVNTEKNTLSTGLSLHYDLIAGNNTNFASNALDWSLKWRHNFKNTRLELKGHLGWTFFGSSEYYPFAEVIGTTLEPHERESDYGTGGNFKFYFTLQNQKYGKLTIGTSNYLLYIIPRNKPDSGGIDFMSMSFLEYSYFFTKQISAFVNSSFYLKSGRSRRSTDVVAIADRVILGIQWTFLDLG